MSARMQARRGLEQLSILLVLAMRTIIDDMGFFYCSGDLCGNWKDSVVLMNNSFHLPEICTQSFSKKWRGFAILALILVCIATEVTNAIPFNHIVYAVSPSLTISPTSTAVSYTHLRAHETRHDLVCR